MSRATTFAHPSIEVRTHRCCDQEKRQVKAGRGPGLVYIDTEMTVLVERYLGILGPEQTTWVDPVGNPEVAPRRHVTSAAAHCDSRANGVTVARRVEPPSALPANLLHIGALPKESQNDRHKPLSRHIAAVAKEIGPVDRCERATTAQIEVWYFAIIEPDGNKPRVLRATQSQLIYSQQKLIVLVALLTDNAPAGEASDENECIFGNRTPNLHAPVLAWPEVSRIPPHRDPSGFERLLQLVDVVRVLPHVRDECAPRKLSHRDTLWDPATG
jgi:hypothetical protein